MQILKALIRGLKTLLSIVVGATPGYAVFRLSDSRTFKRALLEFFWVSVCSLLPLLTIVFANKFGAANDTVFGAFAKYTRAGEIFFFVSPIIGSISWLVITEFRHSLTGEQFFWERLWFTFYALLAVCVSVVMLILYHTGEDRAKDYLRYTSYVIYAISLYFSFLQTMYLNIEKPPTISGGGDAAGLVNELRAFAQGDHQ